MMSTSLSLPPRLLPAFLNGAIDPPPFPSVLREATVRLKSSAIATGSNITLDHFQNREFLHTVDHLANADGLFLPHEVSANRSTALRVSRGSSSVLPADLFTPPETPIDPLWYASDEDLRRTICRSDTTSSWLASISPAQAYETLRSRPSFLSFLENLRSDLPSAYLTLRKTGTHSLLLSDLLLRHPDARILRDVLEAEADGRRAFAKEMGRPRARRKMSPELRSKIRLRRKKTELRANQVMTVIGTVRLAIKNGSVGDLSVRASIMVLNDLIRSSPSLGTSFPLRDPESTDTVAAPSRPTISGEPEGQEETIALCQHLWTRLYFEPGTMAPLLSLLVHLYRLSPTQSLAHLRQLIQDDRLPPEAVQSTPLRSEVSVSRDVVFHAVILQALLAMKQYSLVRRVSDILYEAMVLRGLADMGLRALRMTIAVHEAGGKPGEIAWARGMRKKVDWLGQVERLRSVSTVSE